MSDKTFVDTNVLVYAYDLDAKAKHQIAKERVRQLWEQKNGVLSLQVLQEFYVNVTRKMPRPIGKQSAREIVNNYFIWCIETTPSEIATAFKIEDIAKIGFWDALIVTSAMKAGATRILTEDLNAGQSIAGVLIENPFIAKD